MKKVLLKIGVMLILAMAMCANYVHAATETFGINSERCDTTGRYVYAFQPSVNQTEENVAPGNLNYIWHMERFDNGVSDEKNVYYCLAQGLGDFTSFRSTGRAGEAPSKIIGISQGTYSIPRQLKTEGGLNAIKAQYNNNSSVVAFNDNKLIGLVWILDHMHIAGEDKTEFLDKIPCTRDDKTPLGYSVAKAMEGLENTAAAITEYDIEIAQQLAIWRLTNPSVVTRDMPAIYLSIDGSVFGTYQTTIKGTDRGGTDAAYGKLRENFVRMVYNYFVDGAEEALKTNSGYTITSDTKTNILVYTNPNSQPIVTITREKELKGQYDFVIKKVDMNGKPLQGAVFTVNGTDYTTGADGTIKINGVAINENNVNLADSYAVQEKTAPAGYIKYDKTITVNVAKATATDNSGYIVSNATLDSTSAASTQVNIDKTTNTVTLTVKDEKDQNIDLALRKFITKVVDSKGRTVYTEKDLADRVPAPNTAKLKNGTSTTAEYVHNKKPLAVSAGDKVTYSIRVYNEGKDDAYITEITDYLSKYLKYSENGEWLREYGKAGVSKYESKAKTTQTTTITGASDNLKDKIGKALGTGILIPGYDKTTDKLSYIEVQLTCEVINPITATENLEEYKITNIAEITGMADEYKRNITSKATDSTVGNLEVLTGITQTAGIALPADEQKWQDYQSANIGKQAYIAGQEDDDDFEKVEVKAIFDLALRKFITKVNTTDINNRYPQVSIDEKGIIKYTHSKKPLEVCSGDVVIYTIRVYNEGELDGYATEITDDVPFGLEYIKEDPTNQKYGWIMRDEKGEETDDVSKAKYLTTNYLSQAEGEKANRDNLIKAFNKNAEISETNPNYKDVQIAFKVNYAVKEIGEESRILTNVAQISEDSGDDKDSTPRRDEIYNEKDHEDDIDYEVVKVKYFDLSLLKWVTKAIVTQNGTTKVIESGHTGKENPEPDLKVEINSKDVKKVSVKFAYKIQITNEGEIAGYAKEITDYIPAGLEFKQQDNPDWYVRENGKVATKQLENKLLQPGESATVEIILTWINGEKNLGRKVNVAEISKDYNPSDIPDIDSTPDNKVPEEDDIDDAPVLLVIKTGADTILKIECSILSGIVVLILGAGIIGIKKFVL